MVYRTRIKYTAAQRADIWDRWQRGDHPNSGPYNHGSASLQPQQHGNRD